MIVIKALVLAALIKLLVETENPGLCAGVYAFFAMIIGLAFGREWGIVLAFGTIAFALAFGYFWLLDRLEGSALYWPVLVCGLVIGVL